VSITLERSALRTIRTTDLLAELDSRAAAIRDEPPGTSRQICPACSTFELEVFGTWTRKTSHFACESCGAVMRGDGYEERLTDFNSRRWRARAQGRELRGTIKRLRRL